MGKTKKSEKFSVDEMLSSLTPGDFGRLAVWVAVIWASTVVVVLNMTSMPKASVASNEAARLTLELKRAETEVPSDKLKIQTLRSDLIIALLNAGETLKARDVLKSFKRSLDETTDAKPSQIVDLRNKLAFLYMSIKDIDAAIKQYTINIKDLEQQDTYEAKLLRARIFNDRAVANFLRSQMFNSTKASNVNLVAAYLRGCGKDFEKCKQLLDELARERPGREQGREELSKLLDLNQRFYSDHLVFERGVKEKALTP
jgi:hypothetical protein